MGDPRAGVAETIRQAIDATTRAEARLETFDSHEQTASVAHTVEAARFDLEEALGRPSRP